MRKKKKEILSRKLSVSATPGVKSIQFPEFLSSFFSLFWLHHAARGILVPRPGIEPVPPAVEAWSRNH